MPDDVERSDTPGNISEVAEGSSPEVDFVDSPIYEWLRRPIRRQGPRAPNWVLILVVALAVVLASYALMVPTKTSPPPPPAGQRPNAPLKVVDAMGDLVLEDGEMPSFGLAMIDALSLTLRNDGRDLILVIETTAPFPTVFSPYGFGTDDDMHMPTVALSLYVTAENGKGVWITLIASSLGLSACIAGSDWMLCDARWYEQPVRYTLRERNVSITERRTRSQRSLARNMPR